MAQAFITSYRNQFRGNKGKSSKSKKPVDKLCDIPPPGDYWIKEKTSLKSKDVNMFHADAVIKESTRRQMFTTYEMYYCKDFVRKIKEEMKMFSDKAAGSDEPKPRKAEENFENELLKYCSDLYSPKTQKILPPLPTARRVHGYIRPEAMHTPLTHYQIAYGKAGYDILSNPGQFLTKPKDEDNYPLKLPRGSLSQNALRKCEQLKLIRRADRGTREEMKRHTEDVD